MRRTSRGPAQIPLRKLAKAIPKTKSVAAVRKRLKGSFQSTISIKAWPKMIDTDSKESMRATEMHSTFPYITGKRFSLSKWNGDHRTRFPPLLFLCWIFTDRRLPIQYCSFRVVSLSLAVMVALHFKSSLFKNCRCQATDDRQWIKDKSLLKIQILKVSGRKTGVDWPIGENFTIYTH